MPAVYAVVLQQLQLLQQLLGRPRTDVPAHAPPPPPPPPPPLQASTVVELVAGLLAAAPGVGQNDIGVMATYRKQARQGLASSGCKEQCECGAPPLLHSIPPPP